MNYSNIYNQIINRAAGRVLEGYSERHHILPKCLGGTDDQSNLVRLTAREHFVCHWLLSKMYTGKVRSKMIYALRMMQAIKPGQERYSNKVTARVYENTKIEFSKIQSNRMSGKNNPHFGKPRSDETKRKISENKKGCQLTPEQKERQRIAMTGKKRKPFTKEHLRNLSKAHSGKNNSRYGVTVTKETRAKLSKAGTGRKFTDEHKRKISEGLRKAHNSPPKHIPLITRDKKQCPHCLRDIAVNMFERWHNENCKQKV